MKKIVHADEKYFHMVNEKRQETSASFEYFKMWNQ
jgi:hypothetical protein